MAYTLSNNPVATSNVSYLLERKDEEWLLKVRPHDIEAVFGHGPTGGYDPENGYDAPEWYWTASNGAVMGIGWRWGSSRLRGHGAGRTKHGGPDHPRPADAVEFIEFLKNRLVRPIGRVS